MAIYTLQYRSYHATQPETEILLGTESVENIDEILVPVNFRDTPMFITRAFTGQADNRWRVECVLGLSPGVYCIWLTSQDTSKDVFLSETLRRQRISNPARLLPKGRIVIVEFGHIYQALHFQDGLRDSFSYHCQHQSGEMHKRRPAIVVSADERGIRVVPVTSKEPRASEHNLAIFELENESTRQISEFSGGKRSFALCEMIQTVSPNRILPPMAKVLQSRDRTYRRDEAYQRRISRNDMQAMDDGLLSAVGMGRLRAKLNELEALRHDMQQARSRLEVDIARLSAEVAVEHKKNTVLTSLYLPHSGHDHLDALSNEIMEYVDLD
ncbi:type II toxin-antitoxin system PemK/MazF family toxin [Pantoea agglomerans]|uniref:type II toxin-antitoxin system PemK/MazF family toxin n=1 Tax=Enterobacter agglomerans TaxID=549 RepID=UPI001654665C|nr:type II toxin-antitoxin system PemK/MazF family toxin [Pantoea agglomerans]